MKKLLLLSIVTVTIFSFSSCKRDWLCKCSNGQGDTYESEYPNMRKPTASLGCDVDETSQGIGWDCSLEKA